MACSHFYKDRDQIDGHASFATSYNRLSAFGGSCVGGGPRYQVVGGKPALRYLWRTGFDQPDKITSQGLFKWRVAGTFAFINSR